MLCRLSPVRAVGVLLTVVEEVSLVEHRLLNPGSAAVVPWLSCSWARGIFLDQGVKPMSSALASRFPTTGLPGKSEDAPLWRK